MVGDGGWVAARVGSRVARAGSDTGREQPPSHSDRGINLDILLVGAVGFVLAGLAADSGVGVTSGHGWPQAGDDEEDAEAPW